MIVHQSPHFGEKITARKRCKDMSLDFPRTEADRRYRNRDNGVSRLYTTFTILRRMSDTLRDTLAIMFRAQNLVLDSNNREKY